MQYGRTQSAPLPLAHPGLLAPPEVRQGKTSPELDGAGGSLVKQQIRQSVLSRHHRAQHQVVFLSCVIWWHFLLMINHQPLDPMLAMAELSQMQVGRGPEETQPKVINTCFFISPISLCFGRKDWHICRCGIHPLRVVDEVDQNPFAGPGPSLSMKPNMAVPS